MRIVRLEALHCAGIEHAAVDLKPGLNVLHGPNELGKSTLVEAVRTVLLVQSSSVTASVLDDWHGDSRPAVSLTFERKERIWRVSKTFRPGGGSSALDFSRDGHEFTGDSRGREVDGKLHEMLGWGALPPGGRGGPRGMPSTLLTTALLGRQEEVDAILASSLAEDPGESGREQLLGVLEGLAEDPRLKKLIDAVQEQVGLVFTPTGRRRFGLHSPRTKLREERQAALKEKQGVRTRREESESVREEVNRLQERLATAEAERDDARRCFEWAREAEARRAELERARGVLRTAQGDVTRIEALIAARDRASEKVVASRGRVEALRAEKERAEQVAKATDEAVREAQERVREAESDSGEQERRLREKEAENTLLEAEREQSDLDRTVREARRIEALDREVRVLDERIGKAEHERAEAQGLIASAREEVAEGERRLGELHVERLGARHLRAGAVHERSRRAHEEALGQARAAEAAEEEAASLRGQAGDLRAPSAQELDRLKALDAERRTAREKLAVGLVVGVELEPGRTANVHVDGRPEALPVGDGQRAEVEARRELRVEVPGVGVIRVQGGGKELAAAAEAADAAFETNVRPHLERAGVATVAELADRRREADGLLVEAAEQDRTAAEARVRAERLDVLEREEALARSERDRSRSALADALADAPGIDHAEAGSRPDGERQNGEGASLDEHVRSQNGQARDEAEIEAEAASVKERVEEQRRLSGELATGLGFGADRLDADRQTLEAKRSELEAAADFDWRAVLAGADDRREALASQRQMAERRVEAVRAEATKHADDARAQLAKATEEAAAAATARDESGRRLASERLALAGLERETEVREAALEDEDVEAARAERDRRREEVDGLEEACRLEHGGLAVQPGSGTTPGQGAAALAPNENVPAGTSAGAGTQDLLVHGGEAAPGDQLARTAEADPADLGWLEDAAENAEARVRRIAGDLREKQGELRQVGGKVAEEAARQAQERLDAAEKREQELEDDSEAWRLLGEALAEVEQQETAHLGKALVKPVSSRIAGLTDGRYGDLLIGPDLDAAGIRFAGKERSFTELSVGAREQIAVLLRISIAEVLGAFVILDDQLTQTDEGRMAWLRDLLEEASRSVQVIVLTCHPQDYEPSADAHVVDLAGCVQRSSPAG